jgi:LysM repeat protein
VKRSARCLLSVVVAMLAVMLVVDSGTVSAAPAPTTVYTVANGDSLVGIAGSFGIKVSALLRANDLTLASVIHAGDVLTVPAVAPTSGAADTNPPKAVDTAPTTASTSYQVRSGDALAGIARANGVTLGALVKVNGLATTSVIHAGQTLQLPSPTRPIPAPASQPAPTAAPTAAVVTLPARDGTADAVLAFARQQVGLPYRFFAAGPDAFDCSGLVVASFRHVGVSLPHYSVALSKVGVAVDWTTATIQPGDLVLTASTVNPTVISHVGIAIDETTWIQAVGVGRSVSIGRMPVDAKILAVRRVL